MGVAKRRWKSTADVVRFCLMKDSCYKNRKEALFAITKCAELCNIVTSVDYEKTKKGEEIKMKTDLIFQKIREVSDKSHEFSAKRKWRSAYAALHFSKRCISIAPTGTSYVATENEVEDALQLCEDVIDK